MSTSSVSSSRPRQAAELAGRDHAAADHRPGLRPGHQSDHHRADVDPPAADHQPAEPGERADGAQHAADEHPDGAADARQRREALLDPTLFHTTQGVTSSDSTRVSARSSTGAGVGGYQVSVTQLANSAQRTFSYASPSERRHDHDRRPSGDDHRRRVDPGLRHLDQLRPERHRLRRRHRSGRSCSPDRATGDTGTRLHPGLRQRRRADRADGQGPRGPGRAVQRRRRQRQRRARTRSPARSRASP